jgi:hypothetical protein
LVFHRFVVSRRYRLFLFALLARLVSCRAGLSAALSSGAEGEEEMKKPIIQPWTPSEDERLRKLAAEGRSSLTIAERLKRTPQAIRSRAKKFKIALRRLAAGKRSGTKSDEIRH